MTIVLVLLAACLLALVFWRYMDVRADRAAVAQLLAAQPANPPRFDPAMVAQLPEPARRYLLYTIAPGTPLYTVVRIEMKGQLGLGTKSAPDYRPMRAWQVLASPHGFVWQVKASIISGTDAATPMASWSRFRLLRLIPVARAGFDENHMRSSFGRLIAEAVFWTPAAFLPGDGVRWEELDRDTARVHVARSGLSQAVDVTVGSDGQPLRVSLARWTNANVDKAYRLQPFGGDLSRFCNFAGFRLPTCVEGGNLFGTDDYFPFFLADVVGISFPGGT
ncbi:MAG: DUF6544 family protein [Paracoccaceae bacterium]